MAAGEEFGCPGCGRGFSSVGAQRLHLFDECEGSAPDDEVEASSPTRPTGGGSPPRTLVILAAVGVFALGAVAAGAAMVLTASEDATVAAGPSSSSTTSTSQVEPTTTAPPTSEPIPTTTAPPDEFGGDGAPPEAWMHEVEPWSSATTTTRPTTTTTEVCEPDEDEMERLERDWHSYELQYRADRDLAVYEGRWDDAKQHDLEYHSERREYEQARADIEACEPAWWYFG